MSETQPRLADVPLPIDDDDRQRNLGDINEDEQLKCIKVQAADIIKLSWPVCLGYIMQQSLGLTEIFSLGHLGTNELAASALATMYANVTGFSIGIGMSTALDTLCSQSHTGSSDKYINGKHLQRSLVVMLFLTIPISILWSFTETILLACGQDHEVAKLSATYIHYLTPSLFPVFAYECMKRYLQSQGIMRGMLCVIFIASPINMFLQWLLVWSPISMGFVGAPIGLTITYLCLPCWLFLYMKYFTQAKAFDAWDGWNLKEALNWSFIFDFLKLGIPGIFQVCSEWWAFEIIALAAGWLGKNFLAAQSIVLSSCALTYMIPLGIAIASTTKIGNALGANRPRMAKMCSIASVIVGGGMSFLTLVVFLTFRNEWGYLWTADPKVVKIVSTIIPLAAAFQLSDGFNCIAGGILRGCGQQRIGAYLNFFGYYVIGIPVSLYTAFGLNWGLVGLWAGLGIGLLIVSTFEIIWIVRINFVTEARNAKEKLARFYNETNIENAPLLGEEDTIVTFPSFN